MVCHLLIYCWNLLVFCWGLLCIYSQGILIYSFSLLVFICFKVKVIRLASQNELRKISFSIILEMVVNKIDTILNSSAHSCGYCGALRTKEQDEQERCWNVGTEKTRPLSPFPACCNCCGIFEPSWVACPFVHGVSQARILDGLLFPSPGDLPNPEVKPTSPTLAGGFFTTKPTGKPHTLPTINLSYGLYPLSVQFSCSVMSDSLRPHESQYARPLCP